MASLAELSIFAATPAQVLESRNRTWPQWGRGSTVEEYLERDRVMDAFEHAVDGRLITWVLAPRGDPETLDFKCSCESFQRQSIQKTPSGPVESVIGYGIASVFTPPCNRGFGFARHMMSLLHWVLAEESALPREFPAEWGSPPPRIPGAGRGRFSVLWSDVGPDFYRRCGPSPGVDGWICHESMSTLFNVHILDAVANPLPDDQSWVWLDDAQLETLWKVDSTQMRKAIASDTSASSVLISFLPDNGLAAFQHRRVWFYMREKTPPTPYWGLIDSSPTTDFIDIADRTFATWTFDVGNTVKTLVVTRFRANGQTFPRLIRQLLLAARKCEAEVIEVWNINSNLYEEVDRLGGKTKARDEHLASLIYYSDTPVQWLYNEKFCWC